MISIDQLTKRFGTQLAVDSLTLEIPRGQIVGFLGPNGAGKSTTLRMLTGMIEPTSGSATICGFDLARETIEVKRNVGFVPESGAVFESLTGLEYLTMIAALYAIPEAAAVERIRQFIAFFDLRDRCRARRERRGQCVVPGDRRRRRHRGSGMACPDATRRELPGRTAVDFRVLDAKTDTGKCRITAGPPAARAIRPATGRT